MNSIRLQSTSYPARPIRRLTPHLSPFTREGCLDLMFHRGRPKPVRPAVKATNGQTGATIMASS